MEATALKLACLQGSDQGLTAQKLAESVLTTVYMGTKNSSSETRKRAVNLAAEIGSDHLDVKVDSAVDAMSQLFAIITGRRPRFRVRQAPVRTKISMRVRNI